MYWRLKGVFLSHDGEPRVPSPTAPNRPFVRFVQIFPWLKNRDSRTAPKRTGRMTRVMSVVHVSSTDYRRQERLWRLPPPLAPWPRRLPPPCSPCPPSALLTPPSRPSLPAVSALGATAGAERGEEAATQRKHVASCWSSQDSSLSQGGAFGARARTAAPDSRGIFSLALG